MNEYPFLLTLTITLTALASNSGIYQIGAGETIVIKDFYFVATGIFNLVGLTDASGLPYGNMTESNPIKSTLLQNGANIFKLITGFPQTLSLKGSNSLILTLKDTSNAGNTVTAVFPAIRKMGGA